MIIQKEAILAGDQTQFNVLLRTHYAGVNDTVNKELSASERAAVARAILSQTITIDWPAVQVEQFLADIDKKFGRQPALFKAEVRFAIDALLHFSRAGQMDKTLAGTLYQLNTILLAHALADTRFWSQDNPCKTTVNFLCDQMLGWDDTFGNTSEALRALFEQSIEKLASVPVQDAEAMNLFHKAAIADFHQLMDKFQRLANRMKDSEIGLLKAKRCKSIALGFVNKATEGQSLPAFVIKFLQNKFLHEMQMLMMKHGEDSVLWLRWKKLVETVIKYYQEGSLAEGDAAGRSIMLNIADEIEKLVKESVPATAEFQDFCNGIAYDFSQKASDIPLKGFTVASPLPEEGEVPGIEKKVTQVLINKAKAFEFGQWFIYKDEVGKSSRCKLLISIPEYAQLLFVSLVGQKALIIDYEKFAYLLAAQHMIALSQNNHLQQVYSFQVDKLLENFNALYEAKQSLRKQKELEAKLAKEEKAKHMAAEKARAEAEAIAQRKAAEAAEEAQRKHAEEQAAMFAKIADDLKRQAKLALNSLVLGAWVELEDPATKQFKHIKLALKYNATGRFVFVDPDGTTVGDFQRDELVELVMKRKLKLLESDGQFADRLVQIVKNIRKVD